MKAGYVKMSEKPVSLLDKITQESAAITDVSNEALKKSGTRPPKEGEVVLAQIGNNTTRQLFLLHDKYADEIVSLSKKIDIVDVMFRRKVKKMEEIAKKEKIANIINDIVWTDVLSLVDTSEYDALAIRDDWNVVGIIRKDCHSDCDKKCDQCNNRPEGIGIEVVIIGGPKASPYN